MRENQKSTYLVQLSEPFLHGILGGDILSHDLVLVLVCRFRLALEGATLFCRHFVVPGGGVIARRSVDVREVGILDTEIAAGSQCRAARTRVQSRRRCGCVWSCGSNRVCLDIRIEFFPRLASLAASRTRLGCSCRGGKRARGVATESVGVRAFAEGRRSRTITRRRLVPGRWIGGAASPQRSRHS